MFHGTILMVSAIGLVGVASAFADEPADPPPGAIKLLAGYKHQKLRGIDTRVGKVSKEGGISIRYDIGRLAGNYAQAKAMDQPLWKKEQVLGGRPVHLTFTKDKTFYVTLPEENANFWAEVKSEEDITDILLMVLTYAASERATK